MKYSVMPTPDKSSDMHPIQIDEGQFSGCQVIYGAVSIQEDVLKFDYEIVNDYTVKTGQEKEFIQMLGDILVEIIEESITRNEIIYKGGI